MLKPNDLKPQTITVEIVMGYEVVTDPLTGRQTRQGRKEVATLQLLTKHLWEDVGYEVDDPVPPKKVNGDNDFDSMRYRTEMAQVIHERNTRRLAYALREGGNFQFEGNTLEEQAAELKQMDAGIFNALFAELQNATNLFEIKVSALATTFPNGKRAVSPAQEHDTKTPQLGRGEMELANG